MAPARTHSECGGVVWSGMDGVRKLPNDDKMLMPPPPPPRTDRRAAFVGDPQSAPKVSEQSGRPAGRVVSGQQPRSPKMAAAVCNVACIARHRLDQPSRTCRLGPRPRSPAAAGSRWHSRVSSNKGWLLLTSLSASWGKKRCGGKRGRRIRHL